MKKLTVAIAVLLLVTLSVGMAGYASPSTRALFAELVLWGTICTTAQSVPAKGPDLTMTSNNGRTLVVPLSWTLHYPCINMASFLVDLNPGTYSVTLSPAVDCYKPQGGESGGIMCNLPFTVEVEPGTYSHVVLGIRGGL